MEADDDAGMEQPFYVNAKQYHRILKRRVARARLEEALKSTPGRKPYLHESRHKHAMRRPRGQGGRFLTSAEIAELEKQKGSSDDPASNPNTTDSERSGQSKQSKQPSQISSNSVNPNISGAVMQSTNRDASSIHDTAIDNVVTTSATNNAADPTSTRPSTTNENRLSLSSESYLPNQPSDPGANTTVHASNSGLDLVNLDALVPISSGDPKPDSRSVYNAIDV